MDSFSRFEDLCWHDNAIHGFSITENDDGSGELHLDIDYILEWLEPQNNSYSFRISPATLKFHKVSDLIISINYAKSTACVQPLIIGEIQREIFKYSNDNFSFKWKIEINWPYGSFITFSADGFTQELRGAPIVSGAQYLSPSERASHT